MPRFDEAWTALAVRVMESQTQKGFAHFCKRATRKACRGLFVWSTLLAFLFPAVMTIPFGFADSATDRMLLPIEVLSADRTAVSRTVALQSGDADSVRSLWFRIHGVRYANQASVQVNRSEWIPLNNNTVTIAEPGRDRKSTRLNSSHRCISYAVFCLKKKKNNINTTR